MVFIRYTRQRRCQHDAAILAKLAAYGIAYIQKSKHGLQQMVTIRASADDMQKQVDLGRRKPFMRFVIGQFIRHRVIHP